VDSFSAHPAGGCYENLHHFLDLVNREGEIF
jgi:hypothetical protein